MWIMIPYPPSPPVTGDAILGGQHIDPCSKSSDSSGHREHAIQIPLGRTEMSRRYSRRWTVCRNLSYLNASGNDDITTENTPCPLRGGPEMGSLQLIGRQCKIWYKRHWPEYTLNHAAAGWQTTAGCNTLQDICFLLSWGVENNSLFFIWQWTNHLCFCFFYAFQLQFSNLV